MAGFEVTIEDFWIVLRGVGGTSKVRHESVAVGHGDRRGVHPTG